MKKKHLLLLLGSLLLGGLIGMFGAAFTNLHLKISQEQVQFILTTFLFLSGNTIDNSSSLFYHE